MAGMDLPIEVVNKQISSAVDLIVQQTRLKDGSRKVVAVSEVAGMEGKTIILSDIFKFKQEGIREGKIIGKTEPTGLRPMFASKLEDAGFNLGAGVYGGSAADILAANRNSKRRRR
jgi:pilus assembly protein CpaF